MTVKIYYKNFYKNLEMMLNKKSTILDVVKHMTKGILDYFIYGFYNYRLL